MKLLTAVTPSESFTLTNERTGATFTGSATQGKTEFLPDDVKGGEACEVGGVQAMKAAAQGSISVDGIPQGRWTGAVVFTVDEIPHHHDYNIPIMSKDGLRVEGYMCACRKKAEHDHEWTEAVYYTDGILAGVIKEWKCTCGETLTAEGYDKLYENNTKASKEIMENWIAQNITAGMTDLQKVKAVINEIKTWEYSYTDAAYTSANITRKGVCESGNRMFVRYCEAMGIKAERVDMQQYGIEDHTAAYVWIDGEQHFADATPGAYGLMGSQDVIWTMDGLDLYLDCLNGTVTEEEFNEYMPGYER